MTAKKETKKTYLDRLKEKGIIYEDQYPLATAPHKLNIMFYVKAEFNLPMFYTLSEESQKEIIFEKFELLKLTLAANINAVKEM